MTARANRVRPDLADDLSFIAAHENDPRKEDVIYEAAEAIEALLTAPDDRLSVVFVCGDPTIFISGKQVAKVGGSTPEGLALTAWARARWDAERGEGVEGHIAEKSA
jgi:hypothetical protein